MTARTLYSLPGPLHLTPSQLGRLGRFKITNRGAVPLTLDLVTDEGHDVVTVTAPGDMAAWPLLGVRSIILEAASYPTEFLLETTELPIDLDCAIVDSNTLTNPLPVTNAGGGPPGGCSWAPPYAGTSPRDLLGGHEGSLGYAPAVPPWPAVGSVLSGPIVLYGTPQVAFGVGAAVYAPGVMSADWAFSLPGARHVCTAQLVSYGGPYTSVIGLYADGALIVAPGAWDISGRAILSPAAFGMVYSIRYTATHGGGYYAGVDLKGLLIWPLGL